MEPLNVTESKHCTPHLSSPQPPQPLINSIHYSQDLARRARDGEITHSECLTRYNQHLQIYRLQSAPSIIYGEDNYDVSPPPPLPPPATVLASLLSAP